MGRCEAWIGGEGIQHGQVGIEVLFDACLTCDLLRQQIQCRKNLGFGSEGIGDFQGISNGVTGHVRPSKQANQEIWNFPYQQGIAVRLADPIAPPLGSEVELQVG